MSVLEILKKRVYVLCFWPTENVTQSHLLKCFSLHDLIPYIGVCISFLIFEIYSYFPGSPRDKFICCSPKGQFICKAQQGRARCGKYERSWVLNIIVFIYSLYSIACTLEIYYLTLKARPSFGIAVGSFWG